MRYSDVVTFHAKSGEVYNPDTGEYDTGSDAQTELYANVTDIGTNQQMQLFGALNTNTKTVRLRNDIPENWEYLTIGDSDVKYSLKTIVQTQKGTSLIVGEQQ
ncbi:hypothetical protein [Fructilactobacillus frigidiflavus]|uniref:hypothetical protein n=1 Tax=Fructilactobacillus frigidiflavus TaxID=3242688 RepID=UPI0037573A90